LNLGRQSERIHADEKSTSGEKRAAPGEDQGQLQREISGSGIDRL
jgi:hypothetical protein